MGRVKKGREERNIAFAIKKLNNQITRYLYETESSVSESVTPLQIWIIGYISYETQAGMIFQKNIETEFNIRRSTATLILQRMEKNRLIERKPLPGDTRWKSITLTGKALEIFEENKERIKEKLEEMTRGIPEVELDNCFATLLKIYANIENV